MELRPDLAEVHVALGSYYYHEGNLNRALDELLLAKETQPHHSDLLAEIGYVRRRQGRMKLAIATLKKALELDPRSAIKASILADTYLRMRRYSEAETYYDRTVSLVPDIVDIYVAKAWLYVMRDGDTQAAQRILQKASEMGEPETPVFSHLWALIDACAGDYHAAVEKMKVDDPTSPSANYNNRAAMYGLMGNPDLAYATYDSARIVLEEKVAAFPEDTRYHSGLGIAYAGLGRKEEAIREGELAAQLAPISQDALHNYTIAMNLARTYVMVGEYDAAINQLEALLTVPGIVSTSSIRVNPFWLPLRNHPRLRSLLEKYSRNGS